MKSSQYSLSKILSRKLWDLSQFIFKEVREGYMRDITLVDVKIILREKVRQTLEHIHHIEYSTNEYDEDNLNDTLGKIDRTVENLKERLKTNYKGTIEKIETEIDKILVKNKLKPDKKNVEYKGLVKRWIDLRLIRENWKRDLLSKKKTTFTSKSDNDFYNELEERWKLGLLDDAGEEFETTIIVPNEEPLIKTPKTPKKNTAPLFSNIFPEHLEHLKENRRRLSIIGETEVTYAEFIEILGDRPINSYSNVDGRNYRNTLSKLPKNRKRVKGYRDKSLKEVLSMDVPVADRISKETQIKLLSRISALWNWMLDNYPDFVSENVFKKKSQNVSQRKQKDRREEFSEEDIQTIFNPTNYLPEIFENKYSRTKKFNFVYFFVPIIALLHGCRGNEITMMRTKDIVRVGNIWVYRIREEGEYMNEETTTKNPYSERDIPLHPELVKTLGFVRYVKFVEKMGMDRVFHELPILNNRSFKNIGRWFNDRYLQKLGLKSTGKRISFHSFRHSVETYLTNQSVPKTHINALLGHVQEGVGGSVYLKGIKPEVLLKECVEKIDWGIDFNKLKVKWD